MSQDLGSNLSVQYQKCVIFFSSPNSFFLFFVFILKLEHQEFGLPMKSYAFLAATGYYVVDQSLTTTSNAHQMQDKEQEYMHVEKLVLHKKDNKQCMANSNAIFQKRKSKYSSTTITCNHLLRTYVPTYLPTVLPMQFMNGFLPTSAPNLFAK